MKVTKRLLNIQTNIEQKGLSQIYQPVHKYKIGENVMKKIIDKTMASLGLQNRRLRTGHGLRTHDG